MMNGVPKVDEVRYGQKDVPGVNPPPARSEPLPPRLVSRHEQGADRWIAEDWLDWLRKRVRLAMDLLCSPTVPHEKGPDVPSAYGILSHALAATAPETGLSATETDEQAQVRGESHTKPAGTVHDALHRIADHLDIPPWISPAETAWQVIDEIDRLRELANQASELGITDTDQPASARVDLVIGLRQRGVPQHPDGPEAAALAEIDRLRTEVKQLRARVREWEAVNADLAARCDSGDIPIRLGERYSQAVLREIDRLRAALGSTPDTGDAS